MMSAVSLPSADSGDEPQQSKLINEPSATSLQRHPEGRSQTNTHTNAHGTQLHAHTQKYARLHSQYTATVIRRDYVACIIYPFKVESK